LYKYPQAEFPYGRLVEENRRRGKADPEFELADTGVFDDSRYFDVLAEYAKIDPDDILIRITVANRGPDTATLHLLPTLWFRNTWSWGRDGEGYSAKPRIRRNGSRSSVLAEHPVMGEYELHAESIDRRAPDILFTENETNAARLFGGSNGQPFVKDAFHRAVIEGDRSAVNPAEEGTKAAFHYVLSVPPGEERVVRLRLLQGSAGAVRAIGPAFDRGFADRIREADEFYRDRLPEAATEDELRILRQGYAGLLWSKQFYHYVVQHWLEGDPAQPMPPDGRLEGRNAGWPHVFHRDVISMPDKWEYPWFAAWDLAFHMIPFARIDPDFAKHQLLLLLREWYMHPNGQIPAYEFAFGDVNPPVHAWACWRVYKMTGPRGQRDRVFLERAFHKLLLNFTWWVNRKDAQGNNVFEGGFLGLDNIGVFDRSAELPTGGYLEQSDGTSWMGMFCLDMLTIALELARENPVYEAIATKFFEHFLAIAEALNNLGGAGIPLWNDADEFFYDVLRLPEGRFIPLQVRTFVGLIPLFAVRTIEPDLLEAMPEFRERLEWYLTNRPDLAQLVSRWYEPGAGDRRLLALCRGHRLKCLLRRGLDPNEFLSARGLRALSRYHAAHPYVLTTERAEYT
ncbi:MAG TPA: hypothetical protein VIM84_16610, partial [Gemmatimonadales bacterium]